MDKIPITFEYKGKTYSGTFEPVHGGGGVNMWHLMIDGYYRGRLRLNDTEGWAFDENKFGGKELLDYFSEVVTAWYQ